MNFISLGSWCGVKIALKELDLVNGPSLPFDDVRTSIEGIIDCIENNFRNFFPNEIKKDNRYPEWVGFVGEYVGFYHHNHNLLDSNVIESFNRKISRFDERVKNNNCVFLRIIAREDYYDEIKQYKKLQNVLDKRYPGISYIICYIIPNQPTTQYYRHLDNRTFLFTLDDRYCGNKNIQKEYSPIFDFILREDLFNNIPISNDIEIINAPSKIWLVNGYPMVNFVEYK